MRLIATAALAAMITLPMMAAAQANTPARMAGQPLDLGPFTPEASAAHRGGGVILEGLPGAPAPEPRVTAAEGPTAPLVVRDAPPEIVPPSPGPVLR